MYNGLGTDIVTRRGALMNSITNVKDRAIERRGVLLHIARYKGVPWLETSYAIGAGDCATDGV